MEYSPEAFVERFGDAQFEAEVLPTPMGYPLLELALPHALLFAFDRGAPPTPHGRMNLLLHGVVERHWEEGGPPSAIPGTGGRYRFRGRVRRIYGDGFYLFESVAPLVLASNEPLPTGAEVTVITLPPLMGFRP